jgi:acetyl esterase/lipase
MRLLALVLVTFSLFTSCSKKSEEFQESFLNTGKQQTLYGIKYGSHTRNVMDIALPANRNTSTPVVVLVHGGAWVMGDKAYFTQEIQQFAKAGIACATINYRYASDITNVHHPDLPNDIKTAIDYIASKSEKWQVAPDRFGVCGHSAGGHLALLTAYTLNDGKIKACGSWAGPVDFIDPEQLKITGAHEVFKAYMGNGLTSAADTLKYKEASPYWTATGTSVPTLLVYGTEDIGVPYSNPVKMKSKLDSLGIENSLITLTGANHIWMGKDLEKARTATLNWFKEKLSE